MGCNIWSNCMFTVASCSVDISGKVVGIVNCIGYII